jgi:benzoate membrane transport protein
VSDARGSAAPPILAGVVGTLTGFFGSVAVLLAGLTAAGATAAQAASGLAALCVANGALSIAVSLRLRIPVCFAWSTPGAALLVAAHPASFGTAVGAFVLAAVLGVMTGALPGLARAIDRIPAALSGGLLAGVLLPFCLAPVRLAVVTPWTVLPLVLVWLVLSRIAPRAAGPVVIVAALVVTVLQGSAGSALAPLPRLVAPALDPVGIVALGVPLFLVTMAGQQLPGIAVLKANGYLPPTRLALIASGAASAVIAPLGAVQLNLAAITGAIMIGADAGADRSRRWISGVASGCTYLVLAGTAGLVAGLVGDRTPALVEAAAGLALVGAFIGAISSAIARQDTRVPAAITFLVVGSGVAVAGVGSAFWGVIAGGIALAVLAPRPGAASLR